MPHASGRYSPRMDKAQKLRIKKLYRLNITPMSDRRQYALALRQYRRAQQIEQRVRDNVYQTGRL